MENLLKEKLKKKKFLLNGWLQIPSAFATEVMAHQDWDTLTIDMQHGMVGFDSALSMIQAITSTNTLSLVRVPSNDSATIMKILDCGVSGIICPLVNTKNEAQKFVDSCLYPPEGSRSFGPLRAMMVSGSKYLSEANKKITKIVMIETKEAIDNLEEILSVKGIHGIYIGPNDLGISLGSPLQVDKKNKLRSNELTLSKTTEKAILKILKISKKKNIIRGIHSSSPEMSKKMIKAGFNFVTSASDERLITAGSQSIINKLKLLR